MAEGAEPSSSVPAAPPASTPESVAEVREGLGRVGYLADEPAALVSYLAQRLGKPILVEGPAGVGKTELAKAISRATQRPLIRLQCYEGLDEAKALYEWNYRKQLLRIQVAKEADPDSQPEAEGDETETAKGWDEIFSEEFLLTRPLLAAIAATGPVVLLIEEIDKTDQEFEAMLPPPLSGPRRAARAPPGGGRPYGPPARPQEAAIDRGVDRLGARSAPPRGR